MSVFIELEEWLEWFSGNRARVDMTMAAAAGAGLCLTGLVLLKVSMLDRVDPVELRGLVLLVLITMIPYLAAGLIVHLLWNKSLRHAIPSWTMIALVGAMFVVVSAGAWRFYTGGLAFETIGFFIRDRIKDGVGVFVVLSLFTSPITAAVYYAESIFRAVRRWHEGVEPPSILRDQER
ncbi:MAG TPA: hypothetical protein VJM50_04825 [Pyrinomonadaceae bacterium]|nr:hypothetical protein [Pyrinomonadaceae bacterium]